MLKCSLNYICHILPIPDLSLKNGYENFMNHIVSPSHPNELAVIALFAAFIIIGVVKKIVDIRARTVYHDAKPVSVPELIEGRPEDREFPEGHFSAASAVMQAGMK
jgi:hypothetical protein